MGLLDRISNNTPQPEPARPQPVDVPDEPEEQGPAELTLLRPSEDDGQPLSADDFVFAWQVYTSPAFGLASAAPQGLMEEVLAPDDRTLTIRWRQTYPGAASMADGTQVGFQALPRHVLEDQFRDLDPVAD